MKVNRIIARSVTGIFKDKNIEVKIGKTAHESSIKVNGKELKDVFGVHLHIRVGKPTTLVVEKYVGDLK